MTDSANTDNPGVNTKGPQTFPSGAQSEMDGVVAAYPGVNPGRDQDRSREDECQGSTYR